MRHVSLALAGPPGPGARRCSHSPPRPSAPIRTAPLQWGLDKIQAEQAWPVTRGSGATIAVVDTGVDLGHPTSPPMSWRPATTSSTATTCRRTRTGMAPMWRGSPPPRPTTASAGRGWRPPPRSCLCASSTPAAPAPPPTSPPASATRRPTGPTSSACRWGRDTALGAVGSLLGINDDLHAAIDEAWAAGVVIVVAAGNQSAPLCAEPAASAHVLCVGATDPNDLPSYYSNPDRPRPTSSPRRAGRPRCSAATTSSRPTSAPRLHRRARRGPATTTSPARRWPPRSCRAWPPCWRPRACRTRRS